MNRQFSGWAREISDTSVLGGVVLRVVGRLVVWVDCEERTEGLLGRQAVQRHALRIFRHDTLPPNEYLWWCYR